MDHLQWRGMLTFPLHKLSCVFISPFFTLFSGDGEPFQWKQLTQFTTGGNREAEIATPIKGPAAPCNRATATPVPEVRAHITPIQRERALPLKETNRKGDQLLFSFLCPFFLELSKITVKF